MTAELIKKKFLQKQFEYKKSGEYSEFMFSWAFCSYEQGEDYIKLVLNIDLSAYTDESLEVFTSYTDYPQLAKILDRIVADYKGLIFCDSAAGFGFALHSKDELFNFIEDVSKRLCGWGIKPMPNIDRCSAFPSVEYATAMFSYCLGEDCSLLEVEDYMLYCAGMRGSYDEICDFMTLPCKSDQKFCVCKDTDMSEFYSRWQDYIAKFNTEHDESMLPASVKSALKQAYEAASAHVSTPEEVSSSYNNFSNMWM